MGALELLVLSLAIGADSFSVCVGIGTEGIRLRRAIRVSAVFALFQALLFGLGSASAQMLHHWLDRGTMRDHFHLGLSVVGATILCALGANLVWGRLFRPEVPSVMYRGRAGLMLLAFAVSIDALTAGLGLGMLADAFLPLLCVVVAAIIWVMGIFGLALGRRLSDQVGKAIETGGALLLFGLGVKLFIQFLAH